MLKENADQFIKAYDKYADQIYRYCFFRVYSQSLAQELTQEAFLRTWKYLLTRGEIKNIQAFLYQVCRNLIVDLYRKNNNKVNSEESLEMLMESYGNAAEPFYDDKDVLEKKIMAGEMIKKMHYLSDRYRDVLLLRYVEDMSPKEIAAILNTNSKNISTQISRALKKLKQFVSVKA